MKLAGLIAFSDPPRQDSAGLITELRNLGIRTVIATGDAPATAAIVANAVGLAGPICPPGPIPDAVQPEQFAAFAGILPKDKYKLVKAFQTGGHTVGMCGDGANDTPGPAPGADGHRGLDGDGRRQVGRRHGADGARAGRHRRRG